MIALVQGEVAVRRTDHVVVLAAGVGYRLAVSGETLRRVPAVGEPVTLHAHTILRDDAIQLFGFASEEERDLFLLLLGVQAVGPKVALGVLSGGSPRELVRTLAAGDVASLTAVPGIGKRTAERIVVELREKVDRWVGTDIAIADEVLAGGDVAASRGGADEPRALALAGLLELGFQPAEAEALLAGAAGDTPEALIAAALRKARA